ncbi:hypothetical protein CM49_01847 [Paenibacillus sp. P1XP2]|jgi:hypothetical protein|nr:hypothetical protein CM49_01847 [Paenibacillus sp. P1XP2]
MMNKSMSGERYLSMREEKEFGTEARTDHEHPAQTHVDILKVLEQCGIHPDSWHSYCKRQDRLVRHEPK